LGFRVFFLRFVVASQTVWGTVGGQMARAWIQLSLFFTIAELVVARLEQEID